MKAKEMFEELGYELDERNKEMLYGKKPEVPKRLEKIQEIEDDGKYKTLLCEREPNNKEIREKINQIIEYLEWLDK